MALVDDIQSAKDLWKNGTLLTRACIVISTFLATGAIASLSDVVFAWKGFILDGINFYRSIIAQPLIQIAEIFSLDISSTEVNFLILTGIFMAAIYRKVWVTSKIGMRVTSGTVMLTGLCILVYLVGRSDGLQVNISVLYIYLGVCLVYPVLRGFSQQEKTAYYLPIATAIMLNLFAAAINSGLTR
ncbi:hypothetical protein ACMAZD_11710 [Vibrio sp. nBUS_14]|uniref:hypothetical protein n=1 Tax=Vibrio sp. nBUS_14 TaxID=3395321 RepID=UPI003EBD5BF3